MKRVIIVAAFAVLLFTTCFSPGASAGTFTLTPCMDELTAISGASYWANANHGGSSDWQLEGICHLTFGLRNDRVPTNFVGRFTYPGDVGFTVPVKSVSFDLFGGDGSDGHVKQTLSVCQGPDNCGTQFTAASANEIAPTHYSLTADHGDFPVDADRIELNGSCPGPATCSLARPLEIKNLTVELDDETEPELAMLEDPIGPYPQLNLTGWNSGSLKEIDVEATDTGSGVKRVKYVLGPATWPHEAPGCGSVYDDPTLATLCPADWPVSHVATLSAQAGLKQGLNSGSVSALDGAGNTSNSIPMNFKFDSIPPVVTGLKVSSMGPSGWQTTPVASLSWNNAGELTETSTQSGIVSAVYDVDPVPPATDNPPAKSVAIPATSAGSLAGIPVPGSGQWRISLRVLDRAGVTSTAQTLQFGVDSSVPAAPAITSLPKLSDADLRHGKLVEWAAPTNAASSVSGICFYALSVDRNAHADPINAGWIPASKLSSTLPWPLADGANYVHLRAITCAGNAGQISDLPFEVDAEPPSIAISQPGDGGWYSSDHPLVATIAGSADPSARLASTIDGVSGPTSETGVLPIPLDDGEHTVSVTVTDSIGNASTTELTVKSDSSAPTARFGAADPDHPAQITAAVSDAVSGVKEAYMQFRPAGGGEWQALGAPVHTSGAVKNTLDLRATFPDIALEAGVYDLRVVVFDVAGHSAGLGLREDGSPALIRLPLRAQPSLEAGFVNAVKSASCRGKRAKKKSCRSRAKVAPRTMQSLVVDPGQLPAIEGSLHDAAGEPIAGAQLEVFETVVGGGRTRVKPATTNATGAFSWTPQLGPSRKITFHFAGSDTQLPVDASVDFLVRPRVSFSLSAHRVKGGASVSFAGHIAAPGATYPSTGKQVKFQYFSRGKWRYFPHEAFANADGDFSEPYDTGHYRRAVRLKLRAYVPAADGWAYEAGYSGPVTLVVKR